MRYIDADALIEKIQETVCTKCGDIYDGIKCKSCGIDDTLNFLEDAPTVDVVPREEYEALQINLKTVRYELRSLKTRYAELHYKYQIAVSDGYNKLIVELKEKYTKGGEGNG